MFRGFKLIDIDFEQPTYLHEIGIKSFETDKLQIRKTLDSYISPSGVLDGEKMEKDWFPQVKTHVFISHSHGDEKMAIILAGWLFENFHIKSFIDSCIWGYADDLLKTIDDKYCINDNKTAYDYKTRNFSTSLVHMMLSTALSKMIDKAECLFFLNTPKSTIATDIKARTLSPWIYSEIAISKIIQKKIPARRKRKLIPIRDSGGSLKTLSEKLNVAMPLDLDHLAEIKVKTLNEWSMASSYDPEESLDKIYDLVPPPKKFEIL